MPPDSTRGGRRSEASSGLARPRSYTPRMGSGPRSVLAAALAAIAATLLIALRRRPAPTPRGTWRPLPR